MKIYEKVVIDIATNEVIEEVSYDYDGPIAKADFGGGSAYSDAASAQTQALQQAIQAQQAMYQQTRADLSPYRAAGAGGYDPATGIPTTGALAAYGGMLNIPGFQPYDATKTLMDTPGYKWAVEQGREGLMSKGLASGQYGSGAFQKGLMDYGQNMALNKAYMPYMGQLSGLMGSGQNAAAQTGAAGTQEANAISQLYAQMGQAKAQGIMGQYASSQQGWSDMLGGLGLLGGAGLSMLGMPLGGGSTIMGSILGGSGLS